MDKQTQTDQLILKRAIDAIERHGIKATIDRWEPTLGRHRPDALINLAFGTQEFLYPVEIKKNITWQALGAIRAQLQQMGNNTVLVTDYVNPRIADQLKEANVQFFDTAGNANLNQPPLLVSVPRSKAAAGILCSARRSRIRANRTESDICTTVSAQTYYCALSRNRRGR